MTMRSREEIETALKSGAGIGDVSWAQAVTIRLLLDLRDQNERIIALLTDD